MKISTINVNRSYSTSANQNFKGILQFQKRTSVELPYKGRRDREGRKVIHKKTDTYYVYFPFKDDSEAETERMVKKFNNCLDFFDIGLIHTKCDHAIKGNAIHFTKEEWNKMPKRSQGVFLDGLYEVANIYYP